MPNLKKDPEVVALIEAAVAKAVTATRNEAAKVLKVVSDEFLAAEERTKDFIKAHKGFLSNAQSSIKAGPQS